MDCAGRVLRRQVAAVVVHAVESLHQPDGLGRILRRIDGEEAIGRDKQRIALDQVAAQPQPEQLAQRAADHQVGLQVGIAAGKALQAGKAAGADAGQRRIATRQWQLPDLVIAGRVGALDIGIGRADIGVQREQVLGEVAQEEQAAAFGGKDRVDAQRAQHQRMLALADDALAHQVQLARGDHQRDQEHRTEASQHDPLRAHDGKAGQPARLRQQTSPHGAGSCRCGQGSGLACRRTARDIDVLAVQTGLV
ncbi:hypothetical protein D3C72_1314530 [compost metagenome]